MSFLSFNKRVGFFLNSALSTQLSQARLIASSRPEPGRRGHAKQLQVHLSILLLLHRALNHRLSSQLEAQNGNLIH